MSPSEAGTTGASSSPNRAKKAAGTKAPSKAAAAKAAAAGDETNPAGVAVDAQVLEEAAPKAAEPTDRLTKQDKKEQEQQGESQPEPSPAAEETRETTRVDPSAVAAAAFAGPPAPAAVASNGAPSATQAPTEQFHVESPAPAPSASAYAGSMTATPVASAQPAGARPSMARRARLKVSHLGPLSVLRISLTFSLCMFIVLLVAVAALWAVLDSSGVFKSIVNAATTLTNDSKNNHSSVADWLSFGRVMLITIVLGAANVIAFTLLSTIGALLYNLCSDFVGGIEVTLVER